MKDIELKLIAELMKNSRRSDRELAKAIGTSQPTVTRTRARLEKEGYIKEYTMIPDFSKLGYEIVALSFFKYGKMHTPEEQEEVRKFGEKSLKENPFDTVMIAIGSGLGYSGVTMSFHKSYTSYEKFKQRLTRYARFGLSEIGEFLMSLSEEAQYLPLTLSILAKHLPKSKDAQRTEA